MQEAREHMKRKAAILIVAALSTVTLAAFGARRGGSDAAEVTSAAVTRGSIVSIIAASGTLEAVTAVQVGSQVSGVVDSLGADFNSLVRKGQVLARLDQSIYRSAIEQAQANVTKATAELERARVTAADAEAKRSRTAELVDRQLLPRNDLDNATLTRDTAVSQIRSAEASLSQVRAALKQAEVNLAKTVITSPIDGIVISRNVDVGQTVAASLSAPTLFVIAADLTRMQLNASVDESDMGRVRSGQPVSFTVDAYPGETFKGTVRQVRLNPTMTNNVVTYAAIIDAPNPRMKLLPGMTATLDVEVDRRDNVLRAPAAATRFKPTAEMLAAFGAPAGAKSAPNTVWTYVDGHVAPAQVKLGASDGVWTELLDAPFPEGTTLITRVATAGEAASTRTSTPTRNANPLMGSTPPARGR
jgi:HlyD family secretion protein